MVAGLPDGYHPGMVAGGAGAPGAKHSSVAQASDVGTLRRELQLASIVDLQGSIHANDQKSSAGLVVHGLLFAGVLTVVSNIGGVIDDATLFARTAGVAALVIALSAFVVSIVALAKAAAPYQPSHITDKIASGYHHVFFPMLDELGGTVDNQHVALLRQLREVTSEEEFARIYAAEQVKLADIRDVQAHRAKRGFRWLGIELYAVAAFLALAVFVAISAPVLAKGSGAQDRLSLRWTVEHDGLRQLDGGGQLAVRQPDRAMNVMLTARGQEDVRATSIRGQVTLKCARRKGRSASAVVLPLSANRRSGEGEDQLQATATIDVLARCVRIRSARVQLVGTAQTTHGSSVRGNLTVLAR
jgi:hypothetical protein